MPKRSSRGGRRTVSSAGPVRSPLARLLDAPHLARLIPQLAPETLHHVIRHSGLHACGELVASATPEQLTSVLDLDLWHHARSGRDEQFDADRFGEWVEALVDMNETVAARIVADLDEDLVIAGLSRYVRVFDPGTFMPTAQTDDEPIETNTAPPESVEREIGGYLVRSIRSDTWDAILALLGALETDYPDRFHAVMCGCRRLSNSAPEVDGLDDLLLAPEQHLHDLALDREHRRSRQGYVTPADARAFLQAARRGSRERHDRTPPTNYIATAYFRTADEAAASPSTGHDTPDRSPRSLEPARDGESVSEALDAMVDLLEEAGLAPQRPQALLAGTAPESSRSHAIRRLIEHVRDRNDEAYFARTRELTFLANTLIAGCSVQARPFTVQEASDAVLAVCNLGLEHWPALPETFLIDHDLVTAFEVGWAVLHQDVSMFVTDRLIVLLADLRCVDEVIQDGLETLRRELAKQRDAGTPWRARDALDALAMLDMPAWASILGLLDECPVLPEALTATLERRASAVSATAFEFISTSDQIGRVRAFMARLPDILGR
jgi:hypothetical protein